MFQSLMRGTAALSLAVILAGCSSTGGSGSSMGNFFRSNQASDAMFGSNSDIRNANATATMPPAGGSAPAGAVVQSVCPQISLRDGTTYYRTYAKSGSKDPQDVVLQASLAETTRACTQSDSTLTVKLQVAGRLVAGPQGHAGSLSLPIRVAVVNGDTVVSSQLVPFTASLSSADQPAQFLFTHELTMAANPSAATQIFVGFDEGPQKPAAKPKKHK